VVQDLPTETSARLQRLPDRERISLAFRLHRRCLAVFDGVSGSSVRRRADEDAVDRRRRLEPRSRVYDVAGGHSLPCLGPGAKRDEGLARGDAKAQLEPLLLGELADGERRSHRALRVVLVSDGRAEDGHDRIADELLHGAVVPLELTADAGVVGGEQPADVLGV
jgi:hypothetical protein